MLAPLGLLWVLQGADVVRIEPIGCIANCEPITGGSPGWLAVGTVTLIGGLFLLLLGIRTWRAAPPAAAAAAPAPGSLAAAWATTFALTLTNPSTILSFAAVFAGLGLADTGGDWRGALVLIAGVFLGSAVWWFLLSGGVSLLRGWFTPPRMAWVR